MGDSMYRRVSFDTRTLWNRLSLVRKQEKLALKCRTRTRQKPQGEVPEASKRTVPILPPLEFSVGRLAGL